MVVHNLHIVDIAIMPSKTDSPLLVDTDAVLPLAISLQCFQVVAGWAVEICQHRRAVQLTQFSLGDSFKCAEAGYALALMKKLCLPVNKALDHLISV